MTDMSAWSALRSSAQRSDARNARRVDWHTLRRVGRFARHRRSTILAFLALATISAALGVASPVLAGRAVNAIVDREPVRTVVILAAVIAAIAILDAVVGVFERLKSSRLGEGIIFDLRRSVFDHMQTMPVAFFHRTHTGALVSRLNNDVSDAIATASRFRFPATQLAEAQAAHRPKTYLYQVDWESPARRGALGACHAIEIPFVFGTVGKTGNDRMSGTGPEADRLAEQMMDAWIAFARTGEPGHDGIGAWPAYDTADRRTMIFGRECGAQSAPFEEERAAWESMVSRP